jgi:hypothetical protein
MAAEQNYTGFDNLFPEFERKTRGSDFTPPDRGALERKIKEIVSAFNGGEISENMVKVARRNYSIVINSEATDEERTKALKAIMGVGNRKLGK